MKKRNFIKCSLLFALSFFTGGIRAHAFEAIYPNLPVFGTLTQNANSLPQIFQFFLVLALWGAGILLLGNILYVGFAYMASGANPDKRNAALRRLAGVVLGGLTLFGVFLLLQLINPQLISPQNLSFGICGGPDLRACPDILPPTLVGGGGGGTTGGTNCPPDCPPPPPPPCTTNCPPPPPPTNGFVYYCQGDNSPASPPYTIATTPYDGRDIGNEGCFPTSLAMALSTFGVACNTAQCTQLVVANMIKSGNVGGLQALSGGINNEGTKLADAGAFRSWLSAQGVNSVPVNIVGSRLNLADAAAKLGTAGDTLILAQSPDMPCEGCVGVTTVIHIFLIDYVDPATGTIEVRDPNNCNYAGGGEGTGSHSRPRGPNGGSLFNVNDFRTGFAYALRK